MVFENTIFQVFSDHVRDENGNDVPQYLSVVPNSSIGGEIAGVAVLPILEEKVGLVLVFRHPVGLWGWEAIKGHVEQGENSRQAASRELREEGGYLVGMDAFISLGFVSPEPGLIKARTQLFTVDVCNEIQSPVEKELGHAKFTFFSSDEVDGLIDSDQIIDASTLAFILKIRFKKNNRRDSENAR